MRNVLCALGLLILLVGQVVADEKVVWNTTGGLNFATLNSSYSGVSTSAGVGFNVGVKYFNSVGEKDGLETSFLFSFKNSSEKYNGNNLNYNATYFEVPVQYYYQLNKNLKILGGGYAGVLLSLRASQGNVSLDISSAANVLDYGLMGGVGYQFSDKLSCNLAYQLGLADVSISSGEKNQYSNIMLTVASAF